MEHTRRTLNQITIAFGIAAVAAAAVLSAIDLGEPAQPDLASGAVLATAVFGGIGLVAALVWAARSGERISDPGRLLTGYIIRLAVAEVGMLMGIVGLFMTGSTTALNLGLVLFVIALVAMGAGLRRIST